MTYGFIIAGTENGSHASQLFTKGSIDKPMFIVMQTIDMIHCSEYQTPVYITWTGVPRVPFNCIRLIVPQTVV